MILDRYLNLIKEKENNNSLNILCTDIQFLSTFENKNDYKIGVLNNINSQQQIIKKYFNNVLPIKDIKNIKNIKFDVLLCDTLLDLKKLYNTLNIKYIYTANRLSHIPGYSIDSDFNSFGYWFKNNAFIEKNETNNNIKWINDDLPEPNNIIMPPIQIKNKPSVYIIIPIYNQAIYTVKCLNSIDKYTSDKYNVNVILVDNGSDEQNKIIVEKCIETLKNIQISFINYNQPIGYIKATNAGIKEALNKNADYICLQNNDTVVTKNWLQLLINPIKDNVVGTGPTTNSQIAIQGFSKLRENKVLIDLPEDIQKKRSHITANILQKLYKDKIIPITMQNRPFTPAFFCTMFRADIFKKFLLDECYGTGYGDDIDFCFRIMNWGLQLAYVPAAYVLHNHRTTFSTVYEKDEIQKQINAKLYQCKIVNYLNPKNKKRGVIYTCITNQYDSLPEHQVYNLKDFDYICFTNKANISNIPKPWLTFNVEDLSYFINSTDPTKIARYFKTHPHMFFRNYEISIWIDGNIKFIKDPAEYLKLNYEKMLVLEHPKRNCIYQQAKECIALNKDNQQIINKEIDFLLANNYPSQNGLIQSGIILRNHNNKDVILIMEKWWDMILNYSKRDQLSFNYIVWKYNLTYTTLPWNEIDNNYIIWNKIHYLK